MNNAILYDFESYFDKAQKQAVTDSLTYESAHVPISVSNGEKVERDCAAVNMADGRGLRTL